MHLRLTALAQQRWRSLLHQGDSVIDATAGNGHDTAALACQVGPNGRVFAFDVQAAALCATARRLQVIRNCAPVSLIHASHALMCDRIPNGAHAAIQMIVFNLGYLPHGDHRITTAAASTEAGLTHSLQLLEEGGHLSVIAYRGHSGALEETAVVERFFTIQQSRFAIVEHIPTGSGLRPGPVWWLLRKVA